MRGVNLHTAKPSHFNNRRRAGKFGHDCMNFFNSQRPWWIERKSIWPFQWHSAWCDGM